MIFPVVALLKEIFRGAPGDKDASSRHGGYCRGGNADRFIYLYYTVGSQPSLARLRWRLGSARV